MTTRMKYLTMPNLERLVTETCYSCGVLFAMAEDHWQRRYDDHKNFFCPNGHSQAYIGKTAADKLKDAEARELALRDQLSASIREGELTRKALLRDRQRFMNGVCVCCNRSFENVRRHMESQHPDFDVAKVASDKPEFQCSCGRTFPTLRGLGAHQGHARPGGWDEPGQPAWRAHLTRV